MSDTYIGIRVESELKKKLQELADKESRSLTSFLNVVLKALVAK